MKIKLFLLSIFSFFSFHYFASAGTIDLTVVPSTYGEYTNVGVTGTPVTTPNWPAVNSTLHNGYFLSQSILSANYGYEVFDFGNIALCDEGQGLIINGTITTQNYTKITQNPFTKVEAYIHDELVTCSFNVIDSTTIRYSCSGKGGGNLRFVVNYRMKGNDFMGFGSTSNSLAISKQVNVVCDASNNDIIANQDQNTQDIINNQNQNQQQTNDRLDDIINSDISDADKELPNDDDYKNYQNAEDSLMDKVNQADTSIIDIAIDTKSSNFVWTNLTKFLQSHSLIFGTFIAILSIGIIKLALGR